MAYHTRGLVWSHHSDTGMDGWIDPAVKHIDNFIPGTGITVAHDVLEHFTMDGSLESEMMAFGQLLYIRFENGRRVDFGDITGSGRTNENHFGSDLYQAWSDSDFASLKPIRKPRSQYDSYVYNMLDEALPHFIDSVRSEGDFYDAQEEADRKASSLEFYEMARAWVTRGYLAARIRWERHGGIAYPQYSAGDVFWDLVKAVERVTEPDERQEGDLLKIAINFKRHEFSVKLIHAFDDY